MFPCPPPAPPSSLMRSAVRATASLGGGLGSIVQSAFPWPRSLSLLRLWRRRPSCARWFQQHSRSSYLFICSSPFTYISTFSPFVSHLRACRWQSSLHDLLRFWQSLFASAVVLRVSLSPLFPRPLRERKHLLYLVGTGASEAIEDEHLCTPDPAYYRVLRV